MDADKLNEAAEEYAHENAWYPGETSYESDIIAMEESFSDTFKQGASWLMQQPLADRLTDEEKAELIADFNRCKLLANKDYRDGRIVTYANIFGKELFNEK